MRVVCDTNVLISGILFGGVPRNVLSAILTGKVDAFFSPKMAEEFRAVLAREKFDLGLAVVDSIWQGFREILHPVFPAQVPAVVEQDPDDDKVLACALAAQADRIVTGDRHLLSLGRWRGIEILTPTEFLSRLS